jgi:ferrochelatase
MNTSKTIDRQSHPRRGAVDFDAVILLAYGGPRNQAEIRPFLESVLKGIRVSEMRYQELIQRYMMIGGASPINALTECQARALQNELGRRGVETPVIMGMRHAPPFIRDTMRQLSDRAISNVCCLVMSPFRSEASYQRYINQVDAALEELGQRAPAVTYAPSFHASRGFIHAIAQNIEKAFSEIDPSARDQTTLVFTAHSIPTAMAERSSYREALEQTARLVASLVGHERYCICFQSRSGPPHVPWLGPDITEVIEREAQQHASHLLVAPVGFVCDHLEVLYDLDIEAQNAATKRGIAFHRVGTVGEHPSFIESLAESILSE